MRKLHMLAIISLIVLLSVSVSAANIYFSADKTEYTVGETITISFENTAEGDRALLYYDENTPGGDEAAIGQCNCQRNRYCNHHAQQKSVRRIIHTLSCSCKQLYCKKISKAYC